jgi:LexA-binding, inner membrane-associated putative hydrolase
MFLGHFGLAFAARRVAPATSLGTALLATEFADCLWPALLASGVEQVRIAPGITRATPLEFVAYPWSHSLLMDAIWALLFGGIYFSVRRYKSGSWVIVVGVLSHWLLDWWSHRPDMPLSPWSTHKYGLGLWNSLPATMIGELGLFFIGLGVYLTRTRSKDRTGVYALWSFVVLLTAIWVAGVFGPPPPNITAVEISGFALWLAVAWAYWIDHHRANALRAAQQPV